MTSRSKKKQKTNYLHTARGTEAADLGRLVAEEDNELGEYYVAPEIYVDKAIDVNHPALFFRGPKGIGKSAVLRMAEIMLERRSETKRIIRISPDDLAFSGLANIQATTPILANATANQWLFKSLWDYILCVELLKREHPTRGAVADALRSLFTSTEKRDAQQLLKTSISEDGSPRTLSDRILALIKEVELSAELRDVVVSGKLAKDHANVKSGQLQLLSQINRVASNIADQLRHRYFVFVDDLDLHWVNQPTQNAFIAALFLSLRKLSKPPNLKVLVAIREDIYRRLPLSDKDKGRDRICDVRWDPDTLRRILTKRIQHRFSITVPEIWSGLFPHDSFKDLYAHSTGKPREIIRLASLAIQEARNNAQTRVTAADIDAAVSRFSSERIEDLASEFNHTYRGLDLLIHKFRGWPREFPLEKLLEVPCKVMEEMETVASSPPLYSWCGGYFDNVKGLATILLELGFLLLKSSRTSRPQRIAPEDIYELTDDCWFAIHPMYAAALALKGS